MLRTIKSPPTKKRRHVLMILFVTAFAAGLVMDTRLVQMSKNIYGSYSTLVESMSRNLSAYNLNLPSTEIVDDEDMLSFRRSHYQHRLDLRKSSYSSKTQLAIFYNTYISDKYPEVAYAVIEEQIDKIGKSYLASSPQFNTTIYYTTIKSPLPDGFMDKLCKERYGLTCHHLGHYDRGYEELTLASLYNYCQQHLDERVVYIHSKGKGEIRC